MLESYIHRYAEALGHNRAIMRVDVVVDGELVDSHTEGSPAPLEVVRKHERRTSLSIPSEAWRQSMWDLAEAVVAADQADSMKLAIEWPPTVRQALARLAATPKLVSK